MTKEEVAFKLTEKFIDKNYFNNTYLKSESPNDKEAHFEKTISQVVNFYNEIYRNIEPKPATNYKYNYEHGGDSF